MGKSPWFCILTTFIATVVLVTFIMWIDGGPAGNCIELGGRWNEELIRCEGYYPNSQ